MKECGTGWKQRAYERMGVGKKVTGWNLRILRELEGPPGGRAWCAEPGKIVPTYRMHYSMLVPYVKDYFKWFGLCGIAFPYFQLKHEGRLDGVEAPDLEEGVEAPLEPPASPLP